MDLTTITVAQFKTQFYRDFPYLNIYSNTQVYNTGSVVYYPNTLLFYSGLMDALRGIAPVAQYDHGYKYDDQSTQYDKNRKYWQKIDQDISNFIQDQDIENAFAEALIVVNPDLFSTDASATLGFLYMAAHFLCNDAMAAVGGLSGTGRFPVAARTVGSVSETYQIPDVYKESPLLAAFTNSAYGLKYLTMVLPRLSGNMTAVYGGTNP